MVTITAEYVFYSVAVRVVILIVGIIIGMFIARGGKS